MTRFTISRRAALAALGAGAFHLLPQIARAQEAAPAAATGPAEPFSFDRLRDLARAMSRAAYVPPQIPDAALLEQIDFDAHQAIRFKSEYTLWAGQQGRSPVQFFFPGRYFKSPVRIFAVQDGMAREVPFELDLFDMPEDSPAHGLTQTQGFAGFRVMNPDMKSDWMAFLGASYWRTSGYSGQFGLSVRGLALDTAIEGPEEFPTFTRFWLEPQAEGGLVAYALLESPRATGAYRIASRQDNGILQNVQASIFLRGDVQRIGLAPLTSMFWFGKHDADIAPDWRPEVHDSDGLEILSANGERIWRPINNPPRTMVNTFTSPNPVGFGLMQRERSFARYQDDGVFYDRRASVWVEPQGDWGDGAVTLMELRTDDEIHDNIGAFFTPSAAATTGAEYHIAYNLSWLEDCPVPTEKGRFIATRLGVGGIPGQPRPPGVVKVVCDFDGKGLEGLGRGSGVTLDATASAGPVSNTDVFPVVGTDYWRAWFDVDFSALAAEDDTPIDIRAIVTLDDKAMSETLLLQLFPSQVRRLLASTP